MKGKILSTAVAVFRDERVIKLDNAFKGLLSLLFENKTNFFLYIYNYSMNLSLNGV